ncbi:uncharacterized protein LOC116777172 isoform X1 [Danaus plexippus]|uniref:uncharacterized protein LOC116777172 isoform X1 n=2 Tax=Danaus plexippus TaxID=13037 RepID=UPI002AB2DCA0|nr:uncharacterized protein LOC116777172 isoform X1 [Danaus plexippus]
MIEEPNTMITGEDEPSSGLNGRLRPRKANVLSPQTIKTTRKSDPKPAQEKPKRTGTPSKASPNKPDDLINKSESPAPHILCPYCDKTFFTKQAISKHIRGVHIINTNDTLINCLFCNHIEADANDIIRHMVDNHPNQYFACYDCHTRFPSTTELAEHKHNVCEKQKLPYRNKLRPKMVAKKTLNISNESEYDDEIENTAGHEFNGLVISCEIKTSQAHDAADIEDNITTNFILPAIKNINNSAVIEKNAVIILDDLQWNKRTPTTNFSFHNTDADQILSRLGVVHRSPRAGDFNKRHIEESNQKFEKCFDTSFYSKVASNVQENLTKFLDGSFNFNPDPENTIKTRKSKNSVAINTVEGFPILLECAQFSRNVFDGYLPRAIAPKHKWKWDSLESERNLLNPEQFKRDSHTNNCIISLVSSLDIWTQLCMRQKYEQKFNKTPQEKRAEKQSILGNELKEILESRELPPASSQIVKYNNNALPARDDLDFPISLGLVPSPQTYSPKPAVLSGEWVRPRCYVCCACGAQTRDSRALSSHISSRHPNAQIQHYEIVGEVLLKSDILKHLYVPPSQPNNRTRPLRGIRECTKCRKSISLEDLHQHMLDCAGDTPAVRRKCRYRPFGVRKRRPRLPDNTIRREMRKDIRTQHSRKNHMRPRPKIRTEVGDAETIRKMLADLPAKRHRVTVNNLNPILRPRRKLNNQRNKMIMKKRSIEDTTKKPYSNTETEDDEKDYDTIQSTAYENNENNLKSHDEDKVINHKEDLNKPVVNKNKRKSIPHKEPQAYSNTSDTPDMATEAATGQGNNQIIQITTNNNSDRVSINSGGDGSYREHSNGSNNGSYNRDNNNSGYMEQHNNSRDSFAPSQNIPLKHSIASLTASSETHDKSVQFHHLFLVQQECNNINNHVQSEQRMLFENEAVVTKLDKPPLHFDHQSYMDPQLLQKNKLNKPRKGLNDCIAMLKNKLEEPSSNTLPGHVSVQCGSDEPLGPEPVIIERRHSTAETNNGSTRRSLQMLYPDVPHQNFAETQNVPKRTTRRRSTSTRQRTNSCRDKSYDIQPGNDYIHWKQYYYEPQMFSSQNAKQQPVRRKSLTPADEFLLQHAYMNLELLNKSNRELQNLSDYHYSNLTTMPYKPNKKKGRDTTQKPNSRRRASEIPKAKPKEPPKSRERTPRGRRTRANSQQTNQINVQDTTQVPVINQNDQYIHHPPANLTTYIPVSDKNLDCCTLALPTPQDENVNVRLERDIPHSNKVLEEQPMHLINQQGSQIIEYTANNGVPQALYAIPYEQTVTAPIDLSNNMPSEDNSYQYLPQTPICHVNYETYETLDLSNRDLNNEVVKETDINNEVVVDLSLRYSPHSPPAPRLALIPSDIGNNDIEEGPTDLSIVRVDDFTPTDLSIRRRIYPFQSYERGEEGMTQVNYIQDLSQPVRHEDNVCLMAPLREDIHNIELPTDLSKNRPESRPDVTSLCLTEQQDIYLNVFRNNPIPEDNNIPADLSGRKNDVQNVQYITGSQAMNVSDGLIIHDAMNRQQSHDVSNEIINLHYNSGYRTIMPPSYAVDSDRFEDQCQKLPNSRIISPASVIHDYSNNNPSLEDHSADHSNEVISYSYSDVPLSLTTNSGRIECRPESSNICDLMHCTPVSKVPAYAVNTPIHTMPSKQTLSSTTVPKSPVKTAALNNSANYDKRDCLEINISEIRKEPEGLHDGNKVLIQETSTKDKKDIQNHLLTKNDQNCKVMEINKKSINNSNIETDPETARKIAMLPKELVEILGTMPVDHRNQLLNVLPQYVSTSTASESTESPRSKSVDEKCTLSTNNFEKIDGVSRNSSIQESENSVLCNTSPTSGYPEGPDISLSSSVLLTPPTPQLSERHAIQAHEMDEMKTNMRQRHGSNEDDRLRLDLSKFDKKDVNRNISKRIAHFENETIEDSVIDLTGDDVSPLSETENHLESNHYNETARDHSILNTSYKTSNKGNNDKTASLRAVRIKTPYERNRVILSENNTSKNHTETELRQVNDVVQNSEIDTQKSHAMQRIESTIDYKNNGNVIVNNNNTQDKRADVNFNKLTIPKIQKQTIRGEFLESKNIQDDINQRDSKDKPNLMTPFHGDEKNVITILHDEESLEISETFVNSSINPIKKKELSLNKNEITKDMVTDVTTKSYKKTKKCEYINDEMGVIYICDDYEDINLTTEKTLQSTDSKILIDTGLDSGLGNKNEGKRQDNKIEAKKITYNSSWDAKSRSEEKNIVDLNDSDFVSLEETKPSKSKNKIIAKRQHEDLDKPSKEIEEESFNKYKGKRGRSPQQTIKTKYVENQEKECNQSVIPKNEINREDNLNCEGINTEKDVEESSALTIVENNNDRTSKIVKETDLDKVVRTDNTHDLLDESIEPNSLKINAFITIKESGDSSDKVEVTVKQSENYLTSLSALNSTKIEANVSERNDSALIKYGTIENSKSNRNSRKENMKALLDKTNQKEDTSCQGEEVNSKQTQKFNFSSDVEATVRQSKRGKSQSLQNNNSEIENFLLDAEKKHRAVSSPRHLISTNPTVDGDELDEDAVSERRIYSESSRSSSGSEYDGDVMDTTSKKRKKLARSKRNYKKKRALTSVQARIDIRIERSRSDSKFSIESSIVTNKTIKPSEAPDNDSAKVDLIPISDGDDQNIIDNAPTAKRKSSSPSREQIVSISKPKKCKVDNDKKSKLGTPQKEEGEEKQLTETQMSETKTVSVVKNTTCYNKPMRRIRSKSVVVKSSGVKLYDPYDIDLEDMAEKTEPFIRKEITSRSSVTVSKESTSSDNQSLSQMSTSSCIQNSPDDNLEANRIDNHPEMTTSDPTTDSKETNVSNCESQTKESHSDTDESSKSDEPLKKYAIEKEKRNLLISQDPNGECRCRRGPGNIRRKTKTRGRGKRIYSSSPKVESIIDNNGVDDELRSQQFLESFGFFSERKPRKSNLLASKKIAETFHIIATENDEVYFSSLERVNNKSWSVKKVGGSRGVNSEGVEVKKIPGKRGRKRKTPPPEPAFCDVCKRMFRRSDNFTRHQITLYHISRLSDDDPDNKSFSKDGPSFLIVFKQQLDRLKIVREKIEIRRKTPLPAAEAAAPTLTDIIEDVKRAIKEQIVARRVLSRDEALFVDCCEMLQESHPNDTNNRRRNCNSYNCLLVCEEELAELERSMDERDDERYDGDVDSVTAQNIMESEEVRNLENDLISGLKEGNGFKGAASVDCRPLEGREVGANEENILRVSNHQPVEAFDEPIAGPSTSKDTRHFEVKDKVLPDVVENFDIFEDKFDKIKRKCRSQAAAAKQMQTMSDVNSSHKERKKSEKKKTKRSSKKNHNAVPTKGALKGFDGIKVSIPKSDINMSAIAPGVGCSGKRKKKNRSKKKKERKSSDGSSKYDSEYHRRNKDSPKRNVDVYEFMDTEDTELFEFRPSTLMERFRSISNKESPSTSKASQAPEIPDASSESASDGDDFVYMSDDYVCSDDETENSLLSCDFGHVKGNNFENKKPTSPLKRKDVIEKNAVMGKIFKNNAVRFERKRSKSREPAKPQANLDQLFDSLLEDGNQSDVSKKDNSESLPSTSLSIEENVNRMNIQENEHEITDLEVAGPSQIYDPIPSTSAASFLTSSSSKRKSVTPPRKLDLNALRALEYGHCSKTDGSTYRKNLSLDYYARSSQVISNKYSSSDDDDFTVPEPSYASHRKIEEASPDKNRSRDKVTKEKSSSKRRSHDARRKSYDSGSESASRALAPDDGGVAVQRARRKCTVGKQNVLAESWSSESEQDGAPPRPNSVESVVASAGRKKRGRKRETCVVPGRRSGGNHVRTRPSSYWSDGEEEHEHPQQHGWIVGDSHKKLVTMLAHAKGRKRNDDKRSAVLE